MSSGNEKGQIELKCDQVKMRRGEHYSVQYTFYSTNGSYWIYNPFFLAKKPPPGQLAIYDEKKRYIGALGFDISSQQGIDETDWVFLWGGSHIGTKIGFRCGYLPGTKYGVRNNLLPAGKYYIQLILYKAFLTTNPKYLSGAKVDFYKTFDRAELCRSNAIEVELVDN